MVRWMGGQQSTDSACLLAPRPSPLNWEARAPLLEITDAVPKDVFRVGSAFKDRSLVGGGDGYKPHANSRDLREVSW